VERRKKLRQLRKNVTNTKIMVNDINLMAAGMPSPVNQQMKIGRASCRERVYTSV
jgi:hypothetical protein